MKNKYILIAISISFLYFGCAFRSSGPLFTPAPAAKNGRALIYIYRKHTPLAFASMKVYVDGQKVASIGNKSYTWIHATPGEYIFKAETWKEGSANWKHSPLKISVAPNKTYYIFLEIGMHAPKEFKDPPDWIKVLPSFAAAPGSAAFYAGQINFFSRFFIVDQNEALSSLYECKLSPIEANLLNPSVSLLNLC